MRRRSTRIVSRPVPPTPTTMVFSIETPTCVGAELRAEMLCTRKCCVREAERCDYRKTKRLTPPDHSEMRAYQSALSRATTRLELAWDGRRMLTPTIRVVKELIRFQA